MPLLWTALWHLPGTWVQPGRSLSLSSPTPEHMVTSWPWQCSWHLMTSYISEKQSTKSLRPLQTQWYSLTLWNRDCLVKSVVTAWSLVHWFRASSLRQSPSAANSAGCNMVSLRWSIVYGDSFAALSGCLHQQDITRLKKNKFFKLLALMNVNDAYHTL